MGESILREKKSLPERKLSSLIEALECSEPLPFDISVRSNDAIDHTMEDLYQMRRTYNCFPVQDRLHPIRESS